MQRALVIVNPSSGRYGRAAARRIRRATQGYQVAQVDIDADYVSIMQRQAFDLVVVAGGDGTLRSVLNRIAPMHPNVLYVPCGTLNERAKQAARFHADGQPVWGGLDDTLYTYVVAAGSFTPIGYVTSVRAKRYLHRFAYLLHVLREYKVHRIAAGLQVDGAVFEGTYTLIMAIKSRQCFGFHFNHLYDPAARSGHLLLIEAPPKDDLCGRIRMFFPFFRAFFVGFRRPYSGRHMIFVPFAEATMTLSRPTDFDVDGELVTLSGTHRLTFDEGGCTFRVF